MLSANSCAAIDFPNGVLYLLRELTDRLTDEHVISEGLGCKEVLPKCVCDKCNSVFGHTFEGKAVNDLTFFRNLLRIPGKEGVIPPYRCTGIFNGEEVDVNFSGDGE